MNSLVTTVSIDPSFNVLVRYCHYFSPGLWHSLLFFKQLFLSLAVVEEDKSWGLEIKLLFLFPYFSWLWRSSLKVFFVSFFVFLINVKRTSYILFKSFHFWPQVLSFRLVYKGNSCIMVISSAHHMAMLNKTINLQVTTVSDSDYPHGKKKELVE